MSNSQNGVNQKPEATDPLVQDPESPDGVFPDRVFYATGVSLDAEDFQAEQLYHRSRLARSIAYLHGFGTIAGLEVVVETPTPGKEEELIVKPGIASDRLGRLIEIPKSVCIRTQRWLDNQQSNPQGVKVRTDGSSSWVWADVFLRFVPCERGKTPAFAAGPYDALDAVTPSRIRDRYELTLILRQEDNPSLPQNPWVNLSAITDLNERRRQLHQLIFHAWGEGTQQWDKNGPVPLTEHIAGQNTTSLFLARVTIPVIKDAANKLVRTSTAITINNEARAFVYTAGALASWLGV